MSEFELRESALAPIVTGPMLAPVIVMLAAPPEALTPERPVTVPLPESWEKVMILELSTVSTLALASSIVAVAVQVVSETMFDEHPPSTT